MELERVQQVLRDEGLDGWLFYDFRRSNPIAFQVLGLPAREMYTRRWFYFVPAQGAPHALISAVESHVLRSLPGERHIYQTWWQMQETLRALLRPGMRVAMEYSPLNAIPYIARVDAGTVELVRATGAEVVSSANISQYFVAQLSDEQVESHREAGRRLIAAKDTLFAQLGEDLRVGRPLDEYSVQQRFLALIEQAGLEAEEPPIVAVNEHSGNPHFALSQEHPTPIRRGDFILFDFWAHLPGEEAIFADYTWVAFAGTRAEIPARHKAVFDVVRQARDAAIAFIRERLAAGERVQGRAVDDVARGIISSAGYGNYFVHRTGHSISTAEHGNGANLDNFETRDERVLLPNTCNSVEPGIYLPEFGVRSEVDMLIHERDAEVTGTPMQEEIVALLQPTPTTLSFIGRI